MLNIGAADFVPNADQVGTSFNSFLPYSIKYSIPREQKNTPVLKNISDFLKSKTLLCESLQPLSVDAIHSFVSKTFQSLYLSIVSRGLLLSRVDIHQPDNCSFFTNASGVLVPLDVEEKTTNIINFLCETWFAYFSFLVDIRFVMAVGYVRHNIFDAHSGKIADKHFFFVVAEMNYEVQLLTMINNFAKLSKMPFEKRFLVKGLLPYVCSPQAPLGVVVTVGQIKDDENNMHLHESVDFFPHCMRDTYNNLSVMEEKFFDYLRKGCISHKVTLFHIAVRVKKDSNKKRSVVPIEDVVRHIGNMCNRSMSFFLGVAFESTYVAPGVEKLLSMNRKESFCVAKTLDLSSYSFPINVSHTTLGDIPPYIITPIDPALIVKAVDIYAHFVENGKVRGTNKWLLTKSAVKTAASKFAKKQFLACRRYIGRKILIGTETGNKVFGIDVKCGSIFGLPSFFGGATYVPSNSLFVGTLSSVSHDMYEIRVIIEDVLKFDDSDVSNCSFSERWSYFTQMEMEIQNSWPHNSPLRVVILRSEYLPLESVPDLMHKQVGCCSLGLQFKFTSEVNEAYVWIPPNSIRVKFMAMKIVHYNNVVRVWLNCLSKDSTVLSYNEEYSDCAAESFPSLRENKIVECILRFSEDGSHWWDIINVLEGDPWPSSFETVEQLVHCGVLNDQELMKVINAAQYVCKRCHEVHDNGQHDNNGSYWMCLDCWRATGHGDCVLCGHSYALGTFDLTSNRFFCEPCRNEFSSINSTAQIGYYVPPPPHATFTQQVTYRCISILIDLINPQGPTNDVLELCCGGTVPRKWMRNQTTQYIGVDNNMKEVLTLKEIIHQISDVPEGGKYDFCCGDAFSEKFWTEELSQIHPKLFQTITCFSGLHHAFETEDQSLHFLARVSNALVPGGLFLGIFVDVSTMYEKGKGFSNSVFSVEWGADVPRIGNTFKLTRDDQLPKHMNVVPSDYLISCGDAFHLEVIPKACKSFKEIITMDPTWTRAPTADEKIYLNSLRVFAFKKSENFVLPTE